MKILQFAYQNVVHNENNRVYYCYEIHIFSAHVMTKELKNL